MVILLRLGLACDWATRRPADRVLARSSDLWRAFTLPEYSTRTKKEYGRLPPSANTFILAIGRYTAVLRSLSECRLRPTQATSSSTWNIAGASRRVDLGMLHDQHRPGNRRRLRRSSPSEQPHHGELASLKRRDAPSEVRLRYGATLRLLRAWRDRRPRTQISSPGAARPYR